MGEIKILKAQETEPPDSALAPLLKYIFQKKMKKN